jgi:predicted phosphoribosyltransferase
MQPSKRFKDREEAGRQLAGLLQDYAGRSDVAVLALPRGGVPVAYEVARALQAPLDIFLVRKLGIPGYPEFAMGAIAENGVRVLNQEVVRQLGIHPPVIDAVARDEQAEMARRERIYRGDRKRLDVSGQIVLLVDDGLATGATMRAAIIGLQQLHPARIVVAVPTGATEVCEEFSFLVDNVVCAMMPEPFRAVGLWYETFGQTTDAEVVELLEAARRHQRPQPSAPGT